MIRVTAAPDGDRWSTDDYPQATGWQLDEHNNLDIRRSGGQVMATYRDGTWFRVWRETEGDTA